MRIISGTAKGRRLYPPPRGSRQIRPTAERAREALFSVLGEHVRGSRLLDLFAGTGAVGCEALSRGARKVHFVENGAAALKLIARNISLIPEGPERSVMHRFNLRLGLPSFKNEAGKASQFDLIFADPPYGQGLSERILALLDQSCCLHSETLVIIEEKMQFHPKKDLHTLYRIKERRYGDGVFCFYRPKSALNQPRKPHLPG